MLILSEKQIKIIKILSEFKVIINAGEKDGVEKDDVFEIIDPEKRILEDPDTGEILDEFEGIKAKIIATDVKEKYTICEPPKQYSGVLSATFASAAVKAFTENYPYGQEGTKQKPLNVSEYEIDNIFSPYTNSLVRVGDIVKKIDKD